MLGLLRPCSPYFVCAAAFSLVINLLLLAPSLYMLQVFDRVLTSRHEETLVLLTVLTVAALFVMLVLDVLRARLLAGAAMALDRHLGPRVLRALLEGAARPRSGQDVHGQRDLAALRAFLTGPAVLALFDAPWMPLYLLLIFLFHPLMGGAATVGAVLLMLLAVANERLTRAPLLAMQQASRRSGRFVEMSVRNAEPATALGMVTAITRRWRHGHDEVLDLQARVSHWTARLSAFSRFMRQAVQVGVLATGAWLVIGMDVAPGVMVAATVLLGRALAPVESLIAGWRTLVEARAAASRLGALHLDAASAPSVTALPAPEGAVSAENLIFGFERGEPPVLKGVSWSLAAGESMAVLGPSASGKSTLARLVVGAWRPQLGAMRLDGADLSAWSREALGPRIGYLPQDVALFDGSVGDNIARMSDADGCAVVEAAQAACAHEMILRLPRAYDTPIGEGGINLSGGQRQRIALARALYGKPRLVVLDEPNANLDSEGEEALMRCLAGLKTERVTVIVITHRPAVISRLDRVLVLRDGLVDLFSPRDEFLSKLTNMKASRAAPKAVQRAVTT